MMKESLSLIKCESCRKGYNGRNGNGYMPCGCDKEAKPEYVPPPPLVHIGRPVLGWKPKQIQYDVSDPYKKFNIALLFILSICMIGLGMTIGVMVS